jgi:hypothetical protein
MHNLLHNGNMHLLVKRPMYLNYRFSLCQSTMIVLCNIS